MSDTNVVDRFKKEVLCNGPEAVLPCNLSDAWLAEMQHSVERYFAAGQEGKEEADEDEGMSLPLLALINILFAKNGGQVINIPATEIFECLEYYRLELALEDIRRKTDVQTEPATLESIFTNRKVTINKI
ncbi:hypothetical protein [Geopseudomonas aromaticivorans]